jgi:Uma2 family endonuclease
MAVEVVSGSTLVKDRVRRLSIYSDYGVQEYWIADPAARTIELYASSDNERKLVAVPGLQIPICRIV